MKCRADKPNRYKSASKTSDFDLPSGNITYKGKRIKLRPKSELE